MAYQGISPEVYKNIRNNAQLLDDIAVADLLDLDDGTLKLDPTNNRIGINKANPTKTLDVGGDAQLADLYYTADYPTIRPTLDLAFAQTKQLDSRITFTRSSTGTYVGTDGLIKTAAVDTPRFDHDPVTGESLGLLMEEQKTNFIRSSQDFSVDYWSRGNSTITQTSEVSSIGTSLPYKLTLTAQSTSRYQGIHQGVNIVTPGYYTFSVFVKAGTQSIVSIGESYSFGYSLEANLTTKQVTYSGYVVSGGIQEYPNGWFRIHGTWNLTSFSGTYYTVWDVYIGTNSAAGLSCYVWGAQVEQTAYPTSYIPTSGSTVTRSADTAQITGTNFSNIYNPSEGTLYLEAIGKGVGNTGSNATFQIDDGTSNNRITLINDNETFVNSLITVGGTQTNLTASPSFTTDVNKNAIAYKSGDNASSLNGSTVVTNTSISTLPVVNTFRFGSNANGTSNNTIRRAVYYPRRLNNSQLQNITL